MSAGASPDLEGADAVDLSGIEERLRSIDQSLIDIRQTGREIEKRVGESEKWRAATEAVIEMQIERIDSNADATKLNTDWISRTAGGMAANVMLISSMTNTVGMLAIMIKMVFFHG